MEGPGLDDRIRRLYQANRKSIMRLSRTKNKGGKATTQVDVMLETGEVLLSVNVRPSRVVYTEDKSFLTFFVKHDPKLSEMELDALFERALADRDGAV
ncbi:MAG: hypothetical protein GXY70_02870 [Euryarchaeota archaeon]|nr:hypothetical protein [Euryarchaeota archaeon]